MCAAPIERERDSGQPGAAGGVRIDSEQADSDERPSSSPLEAHLTQPSAQPGRRSSRVATVSEYSTESGASITLGRSSMAHTQRGTPCPPRSPSEPSTLRMSQ